MAQAIYDYQDNLVNKDHNNNLNAFIQSHHPGTPLDTRRGEGRTPLGSGCPAPRMQVPHEA